MPKPPTSGPRTPKAPAPIGSEIAPGIFVGGWRDAERFEGARICVLDDMPDETLDGMAHVPVYREALDQPLRENLDRIVTMVEAARGRHEPVMLFCGHGVRRSPLAAAWYLHRHEGIPLAVAYERIESVRPQVERVELWVGDPSPLEAP